MAKNQKLSDDAVTSEETESTQLPAPKQYKILHSLVGPFERGRVVASDDPLLKGVDIERLIALKAIEEVDEPKTTEPLPPGPENRAKVITSDKSPEKSPEQ